MEFITPGVPFILGFGTGYGSGTTEYDDGFSDDSYFEILTLHGTAGIYYSKGGAVSYTLTTGTEDYDFSSDVDTIAHKLALRQVLPVGETQDFSFQLSYEKERAASGLSQDLDTTTTDLEFNYYPMKSLAFGVSS